MANEVVLLRHGATEWSKSGQHTGSTDIPLLEEGRETARAMAPRVAQYTFAAVFTSPLQRARETAELVGIGAQAEIDPDLLEWDYGDYEGVTTKEIRKTVPGWTIWTGPVPNGETPEQVAARRRSRHRARRRDRRDRRARRARPHPPGPHRTVAVVPADRRRALPARHVHAQRPRLRARDEGDPPLERLMGARQR